MARLLDPSSVRRTTYMPDADYEVLRARYDDLRAAVRDFLDAKGASANNAYYALFAAYERTGEPQ